MWPQRLRLAAFAQLALVVPVLSLPHAANVTRALRALQDRALLGGLLQKLGLRDGVEVGVERGEFTRQTLAKWTSCRSYLLVDAWNAGTGSGHYANADRGAHTQIKHDQKYAKMRSQPLQRGACHATFGEAIAQPGGACGTRVSVCANWSHVCSATVPDSSFDFVYLDALQCARAAMVSCGASLT